MNIIKDIKTFQKWILGKTKEIGQLSEKDAYLSKVMIRIKKHAKDPIFKYVPLFSLNQLHSIDRKDGIEKLEERVKILRKHKKELLKKGKLSREIQDKHIQSITWIKAVRENSKSFYVFEGNGRIAALKKVFSPKDSIRVEIKEYIIKDKRNEIFDEIAEVRKMNKF